MIKIFQKQKPMLLVIYALIPSLLLGMYNFGIRVLILLFINTAVAYFWEFLFVRKDKKPVTQAVLVTSLLYTMTLPPTLPYWISILGITVAIVFGKMVFGGFGKNIFNPALVGRAFIYVSFGNFMTARWVNPTGIDNFFKITYDSLTSATPLVSSSNFTLQNIFVGLIPGSIGETSALLLLLGGIFLLVKKISSLRSVASTLISFSLFQTLLWLVKPEQFMNPVNAILSGGFMLGLFFMVTDPVSSPMTNQAKIIYGIIIGISTVVIREFAAWREGMMFAILLGNMFGPIFDYFFKQMKTKKKNIPESA